MEWRASTVAEGCHRRRRRGPDLPIYSALNNTSPTGSGKQLDPAGGVSLTVPTPGRPHNFTISVGSSGMATASVSTDGTMIGEGTATLGTGPFCASLPKDPVPIRAGSRSDVPKRHSGHRAAVACPVRPHRALRQAWASGEWRNCGKNAGTGRCRRPDGLASHDVTGFGNEVRANGMRASGKSGLSMTKATIAGTHELASVSAASSSGLDSGDITAVGSGPTATNGPNAISRGLTGQQPAPSWPVVAFSLAAPLPFSIRM